MQFPARARETGRKYSPPRRSPKGFPHASARLRPHLGLRPRRRRSDALPAVHRHRLPERPRGRRARPRRGPRRPRRRRSARRRRGPRRPGPGGRGIRRCQGRPCG
ncbi:hypothetical protein EF910_32270 [Streptomyces sp. WAC07149]|nr:hypothetical protein EF910_32270 [Streptomyces sp. WAC07149]